MVEAWRMDTPLTPERPFGHQLGTPSGRPQRVAESRDRRRHALPIPDGTRDRCGMMRVEESPSGHSHFAVHDAGWDRRVAPRRYPDERPPALARVPPGGTRRMVLTSCASLFPALARLPLGATLAFVRPVIPAPPVGREVVDDGTLPSRSQPSPPASSASDTSSRRVPAARTAAGRGRRGRAVTWASEKCDSCHKPL